MAYFSSFIFIQCQMVQTFGYHCWWWSEGSWLKLIYNNIYNKMRIIWNNETILKFTHFKKEIQNYTHSCYLCVLCSFISAFLFWDEIFCPLKEFLKISKFFKILTTSFSVFSLKTDSTSWSLTAVVENPTGSWWRS